MFHTQTHRITAILAAAVFIFAPYASADGFGISSGLQSGSPSNSSGILGIAGTGKISNPSSLVGTTRTHLVGINAIAGTGTTAIGGTGTNALGGTGKNAIGGKGT